MKTKSFKIYTGDPSEHQWVEVSETISGDHVRLAIVGGGTINLDAKAWEELCSMKYNLECKQFLPLSQVPILTVDEAKKIREDAELVMKDREKITLPTADATIKRLARELSDDVE